MLTLTAPSTNATKPAVSRKTRRGRTFCELRPSGAWPIEPASASNDLIYPPIMVRRMFRSFGFAQLRVLVVVACSSQACAGSHGRLQAGAATAITSTVVQSSAEAAVTMPRVRIFHPSYGNGAAQGMGVLFGAVGTAVGAEIDSRHQAEMYGGRPAAIPEKNAEELTRMLQEQTADVDFREQYEHALQGALSKIGWLKLQRVERETPALPDRRAQDVGTRSLLRVVTTQRISADGRLLLVQSTLGFHPKGGSDGPSAEMVIKYRSEEIGAESPTGAVGLWATNHGQAYRRALGESVVENMKMTTMALEHMAGTSYGGRAELLKVHMESESADAEAQEPALEITGTVVEESAHRLILEAEWLGAHWLLSLPKNAIEARFLTGATRGIAWRAAPAPAPVGPAAAAATLAEPGLAPAPPNGAE